MREGFEHKRQGSELYGVDTCGLPWRECSGWFAGRGMIRCFGSRFFFFFQAEDGIRDVAVTGVQTCALPILDRPLSVVRCPDGTAGQCFFQKHLTAGMPKAVRGIRVQERSGSAEYIAVAEDRKSVV